MKSAQMDNHSKVACLFCVRGDEIHHVPGLHQVLHSEKRILLYSSKLCALSLAVPGILMALDILSLFLPSNNN